MELVTERRTHLLRTARCWFPGSCEPVLAALRDHHVVTAVQCSRSTAERLCPLAFSTRPLVTTVVDLERPEELLLRDMDRTCRDLAADPRPGPRSW
jgi:hypothetical protein